MEILLIIIGIVVFVWLFHLFIEWTAVRDYKAAVREQKSFESFKTVYTPLPPLSDCNVRKKSK